MAGPAVVFRQLDRVRRFAHELSEQIRRLPMQVKAQQGKLARQEGALTEINAEIKRLKVSIHEMEVSLKTNQGLVKKHERQLNESESKKEYDALKLEIATERQNCAQLEEDILTAMTRADECLAQVPELEKAAQQAREDYATFEKDIEKRKAMLQTQLDEARGQEQQLEAEIPEELRIEYQRILKTHGMTAITSLRNRSCSACYTEVTAQNYNELLQDLFVRCKACGRILYIAE